MGWKSPDMSSSTIFTLSFRILLIIFSMVLSSQLPSIAGAIVKSSPTTTTSSSAKSSPSSLRNEALDDYDDENRLNQLWLDDFETEFSEKNDDGMMSDSPSALSESDSDTSNRSDKDDDNNNNDDSTPTCPPPPSQLPSLLCDMPQCVSDLECGVGTICCYNGCKYACLAPVQGVPYTDWKRQPQRRLVSGSSWLVPGPVEMEEAEWCSTSEMYDEDEDPLLCPQGYFCLVEEEGDPAKGIPNRGRCVLRLTENIRKKIEGKLKDGLDCRIGKRKYRNGRSFKLDTHTCECQLGSVLCHVGRPNHGQTNGSTAQNQTEGNK